MHVVKGSASRWGVALSAVALVAVAGCSSQSADSPTATPTTPAQSSASQEAAGEGLPTLTPEMFENEPAVNLRYSTFSSAEGTNGAAGAAFKEKLEEITGGNVSVEAYYSASLLPPNEVLAGLRSGVADVGPIIVNVYPSQLPIQQWLSQLGALVPAAVPNGGLAAQAAFTQFQFANQASNDEWARNGLKFVGVYAWDVPQGLACATPVATLDDFKGKRVRTSGGAWADEIKALGAVPVQIPITETAEALKRGTVDCVAGAPPATQIDYGMADAVKYFVPTTFNSQNTQGSLVMNQAKWESLTPLQQQAVLIATNHGAAVERSAVFERYADYATNQTGITWVDPKPFDDALDAFHEEVVAAMPAAAPAALTDPAGVITSFESDVQGWMDVATDLVGPAEDRDPENIRMQMAELPGIDLTRWDAAVGELYVVKSS